MRVKSLATAGLAAAALALAGAGGAHAAPAAGAHAGCDRACLKAMVDQYLSAVVAHDARRLPLAADVRYTEDGQTLALDDGFWGTASGVGKYKHYFLDPVSQQAGFYGVMLEKGHPVILALRLRLEGGKISEIETVLARSGLGTAGPNGAPNLEKMGEPGPIWRAAVPSGQRMSRAEMVRVANMYFTGLQGDNGKGVYPFSSDCNRIENGMQTTNHPMPTAKGGFDASALGCKAEFQSGFFQMVTRIRDRRFPVVDEQQGAVFAFAFFDHAGRISQETLSNGRTIPVNLDAPFTWEIAESFKVQGGLIHQVEAVLNNVPYGMKGGWNGH